MRASPGCELRVGSIFFGGGTPSLLTPEQIGRILDAAWSRFDVAADAEVTLEANPNDLSLDYLRRLREAGVNRLSIGVQSFDDCHLRRLGRRHDAAGAIAAYEAARAAGFDNVSLDLMFALPDQTLAEWQASLERAIALGPEHLSLYNLTVEPETPFAEWQATGKLTVPDDDAAADMVELAIDWLDRAGYAHYEISNWARQDPAVDFRAQHNLRYWRNQPYLGVGAGAHSSLAGYRFANVRSVPGYIARIGGGASPVDEWEMVSPVTAMGETMMLGLRLSEGVSVERFRRWHHVSPEDVFGATLAELERLGLVERGAGDPDGGGQGGGVIRLTPRGRMLGNEVFGRFVSLDGA
ncbi:MAG: radical SAM family heme chaperone HemW [Chloroflexi bacterium]|nr:radical SAM family heme chaperone HemW [Chloroflexota bacterium]